MKKQNIIIIVFIPFLIAMLTNYCFAFNGYNKTRVSEKEIEMSLFTNLNSKIDWEIQNTDVEIERKFIGFGVTNPLSKTIDVYCTLNYIYEGEIKYEDFNKLNYDTGFFTNIGIKMNSYNEDKVSVFVYGQFNFIFSDDWSYSNEIADYTFENSGIELSFGANAKYSINDSFSIYGGIELVPFSDIEGELIEKVKNGASFSDSDDYERESFFSLKIGAEYSFKKFEKEYNVASEITFGNEQSFALCVSIPM